jgi:phosphate transport system substrate-binding protein
LLKLTNILLITFFLSSFNATASDAIAIDGSTGVKPLIEALAVEYMKTKPSADVIVGAGLKPNERIDALVSDRIQVAMASHGIEREQLARFGLKLHPIASVAVVIGVHQDVNLSSISHQQLCDIYSGKTLNWRTLTGDDLLIDPFIRPFDEVDSEVVVANIPCFAQITLAKHVQLKKKSGQMARALSDSSGSIGMTTLIRVAQSNNKIKALAINKVKPDRANLLSGHYALTRELFLITSAQPKTEVSQFLAFIRSEQGSKVIIANYAIPVENAL